MKKLVRLHPKGRVVFVGDTHGYDELSRAAIEKYLDCRTRIVFLGDYVDGPLRSKENADYILEQQKQHPRRIFPLQGNHEGYRYSPYDGASFWRSLSVDDWVKYSQAFGKLPLAASVGPIIATHGMIPNVKRLEDINDIENGDDRWREIVWGDYISSNTFHTYDRTRPKFSEGYFNNTMRRLGKKIHIRGHDHKGSQTQFDNRCLTMITSQTKNVAIADFDENKRIESTHDLHIESLQ